jgi:hypothetical protein
MNVFLLCVVSLLIAATYSFWTPPATKQETFVRPRAYLYPLSNRACDGYQVLEGAVYYMPIPLVPAQFRDIPVATGELHDRQQR